MQSLPRRFSNHCTDPRSLKSIPHHCILEILDYLPFLDTTGRSGEVNVTECFGRFKNAVSDRRFIRVRRNILVDLLVGYLIRRGPKSDIDAVRLVLVSSHRVDLNSVQEQTVIHFLGKFFSIASNPRCLKRVVVRFNDSTSLHACL